MNKLRFMKDNPKDLVIGSPSTGTCTSSPLKKICVNVSFISKIEAKNVDDVLSKESWGMAMHVELNQIIRRLVSKPNDHSIYGSK